MWFAISQYDALEIDFRIDYCKVTVLYEQRKVSRPHMRDKICFHHI